MQQLYVPPLSKLNKILLISFGVVFLLQSILQLSQGMMLESFLGLSLVGLKQGFIFQVLTYPFVQQGLFALIFDGLVLWFFGGELEVRWGQKIYARFLLSAIVGGALFYLLIVGLFFPHSPLSGLPLLGPKGLCFAILMAYGIIFSENMIPFMLIFPMKAKYFCLILAVIELYTAVFSPAGQAIAVAHLGAAGFGYLHLWWQARKRQQGKKFSLRYQFTNKKKNSAHLQLVEEEENSEKDPKYWQ